MNGPFQIRGQVFGCALLIVLKKIFFLESRKTIYLKHQIGPTCGLKNIHVSYNSGVETCCFLFFFVNVTYSTLKPLFILIAENLSLTN